jgi:hypothetical protein
MMVMMMEVEKPIAFGMTKIVVCHYRCSQHNSIDLLFFFEKQINHIAIDGIRLELV